MFPRHHLVIARLVGEKPLLCTLVIYLLLKCSRLPCVGFQHAASVPVMHVHTHTRFQFSFIEGCYKILDVVLCALQKKFVFYLFYVQWLSFANLRLPDLTLPTPKPLL